MSFVAEKLRLARIASGLSLEELGASVSATRQYIHQLENKSKNPTDDMINAIVDILGVTRNFFYEPSETIPAEHYHFRKQLTTPASITGQVIARGTILDSLVAEIDQNLNLPSVNFPSISIKNEEEIERAAEKCRLHWGLGLDGPIVNMTRVVEHAGAVVAEFKGISDRVDALSIDRPRPIIIRSVAKASLSRLRFDLAHEAAHFVLHKGIVTGDQATEAQANRFASAFLMPRSAFVKEFKIRRNLDWKMILSLKLRWKTSLHAIIRRAYDLRLINAAQYRSGNIHLVKTGQAKTEKYDDTLPLEEPEILVTSIKMLEKVSPGSVQRICQKIGISNSMFELVTGHKMPISSITNDPKIIPLSLSKISR